MIGDIQVDTQNLDYSSNRSWACIIGVSRIYDVGFL